MRTTHRRIGEQDRCVRCESPFVRTHGRQRYCSSDCKKIADNENRTNRYRARAFACRRCGESFTRDECTARKVYCSDDCRLADDRDTRSTFEYDRTQSPEHIAKRTAAMKATLAKQRRICERCSEEFTPTSAAQRYCSGQCWNAVASQRRTRVNRPRISRERYAELLEQQGGACAICGSGNRSGHRLAADHDHKTGAIRGLLCHRCNTAIGLLRDDPELLRAAIGYLSKFN